MKSDEQILAELKEAAAGLYVMSESDFPFEVIRWEGTAELSPQYLRELHGEPDDAPVKIEALADFPGFVTTEVSAKGGAASAGESRYQHLLRVLTENLSGVRVHRVGRINIPVYVVGRSPGGNWVGVSTRVVET